MNTQRWLVLGFVGLVIGLIVVRPLLADVASSSPDNQTSETEQSENPTPAPFVTETLPPLETTQTPEEEDDAPFIPTRVPENMAMGEAAMMEEETVSNSSVPPAPSGPFVLARGDFVQIDSLHGGEGTATVYQGPDGQPFVRLEPFSVTDAPDLRVALSTHPAPLTQSDLQTASGFLDLGPLQAISGAQNYDVPLSVRLEQFQSVVIYDRQFNIIFTTATLNR